MNTDTELKRYLNLPLVTFYGLGTIVGAGIYVLISEVARVSGSQMPLAFLVAGAIAVLTGASYAELCTRFPRAAGAVLYVDHAFGRPGLSIATGFMLLLTGIVSAATICKGFFGYLAVYVALPQPLVLLLLAGTMGAIATVGIRESAWTISSITLLEICGLLFVVAVATAGEPIEQQSVEAFKPGLGPLVLGAYLAFYAFIGFEDMVNLAEEVKNPERTLPRAILLSITLASFLYVLVAWVALRYVDFAALAESRSPLALMVADSTMGLKLMGLIGMIAITNGALTQIIMSSRVIYGMAHRGLLPLFFSRINTRTQTPVFNTWLITVLILGFALWLPLVTLAQITSAIMLVIFVVVNLSLLRVKSEPEHDGHPHFTVWTWVPLLGLLLNLALLGYQLSQWI